MIMKETIDERIFVHGELQSERDLHSFLFGEEIIDEFDDLVFGGGHSFLEAFLFGFKLFDQAGEVEALVILRGENNQNSMTFVVFFRETTRTRLFVAVQTKELHQTRRVFGAGGKAPSGWLVAGHCEWSVF